MSFSFAVALLVGISGIFALNLYALRHLKHALKLGRRGERIAFGVLLLSIGMLMAGRLLVDGTVGNVLVSVGFTVQLGVLIAAPLGLSSDLFRVVEWFAHRRARRTSASVEPLDDRVHESAADDAIVPGVLQASELDRDSTGSTAPDADFSIARESNESDLGTDAPSPRLSAQDSAPVNETSWFQGSLLGRRDFLSRSAAGSAVAIGGGSSAYGLVFGRVDYQIEEVPIVLPGLSRARSGYTIVQLSDIHFGDFIQDKELRSATELVRKARADAVVLTGDLVDHDPAFAPYLGRLVRSLEGLTRDGVFAIPGNHDHYAGVEATMGAVRDGGGTVLKNAGHRIGGPEDGIALLGVDDVWARRSGVGGPDLERAIADVDPHLPRVLLSHNPVFFDEAIDKVQLQLSGHTHGGQVQLGINPAEWVLPYVKGRYEVGESQLYVNRGFGTAGPPARIGSPPEVTKIILV
ncbi:MAG: metallophosphoesterase [Myxococcota bacterium]